MLKLEAVGQSYDHDHDCLQSTHRQKRHFHLPTSHTFTQLVADAVNTTVTRQWFQLVRIETQPERNGIQRSSSAVSQEECDAEFPSSFVREERWICKYYESIEKLHGIPIMCHSVDERSLNSSVHDGT